MKALHRKVHNTCNTIQAAVEHRRKRLHIPQLEHYAHLAYFAVITFGGPYHYFAGLCLAVGVLAVFLHMEG